LTWYSQNFDLMCKPLLWRASCGDAGSLANLGAQGWEGPRTDQQFRFNQTHPPNIFPSPDQTPILTIIATLHWFSCQVHFSGTSSWPQLHLEHMTQGLDPRLSAKSNQALGYFSDSSWCSWPVVASFVQGGNWFGPTGTCCTMHPRHGCGWLSIWGKQTACKAVGGAKGVHQPHHLTWWYFPPWGASRGVWKACQWGGCTMPGQKLAAGGCTDFMSAVCAHQSILFEFQHP
jgi:hypothetical protein